MVAKSLSMERRIAIAKGNGHIAEGVEMTCSEGEVFLFKLIGRSVAEERSMDS